MPGPPPLPAWTRDADRVLVAAMREVRLLAAATPVRGTARAEIVAAFEAGRPRLPAWTYARHEPARALALATVLESLAEALEGREETALGHVYAARARELALESTLASEVGTERFGTRARLRFPADDVAGHASNLARAWASDAEPAPTPETTTDAEEPGSMVVRMREEIGRHKVAFRVSVADGLAPLAATGDHTVWVTAGRRVARVDVERTVVHEIEGHVLPRARASAMPLGIFAIGTARGTDDQEGLALLFEERSGFLRGARRRELALRHRAVEAMDAGGTFVDVVKTLIERDGAAIRVAVAAAERAFRGSDGIRPGLGRERVYLSAYTRVREHVRSKPDDEKVMTSGQVALDAIASLRHFVA